MFFRGPKMYMILGKGLLPLVRSIVYILGFDKR